MIVTVGTGLEVIEITSYVCPICEVGYKSKGHAERCLAQGIQGDGKDPEINPGLIVKNLYTNRWKNVYSIFCGESNFGHYKISKLVHLQRKFERLLKNRFKQTSRLEYLSSFGNVGINEDFNKSFIEEISNRIELLTEEEFLEIKNELPSIDESELFASDNLHIYREEVVFAFDNLYRYHEFFDGK